MALELQVNVSAGKECERGSHWSKCSYHLVCMLLPACHLVCASCLRCCPYLAKESHLWHCSCCTSSRAWQHQGTNQFVFQQVYLRTACKDPALTMKCPTAMLG